MAISDRETIINRLLSLPRTHTRNAPACCAETALKSLQLSEETDYQAGRAFAYLSLGEYAMFTEREGTSLEQTGGAYDHFIRAGKIFAEIGNEEGRMLTDLRLGLYLLDRRRLPEAEVAFNGAMHAAESGGDGQLCGNVLVDAICGIGSICAARQNFDEARSSYEKALEYCSEERNNAKRAGVMYRLGILEQTLENDSDAQQLFSQAIDLAVRDGEYRTAAAASRALSRIHYAGGQFALYERYSELSSGFSSDAARDEAANEIKNLRSYYVNENARVIANAEQHLKDRLFDRNMQLEEANWQLNTIYNIGQSITALLDIDEVLRTLYTELRVLMNLDSFFIAAYNGITNSLEYQILYEDGREYDFLPDERRQVPAGDLAYWCVYKDDNLVIKDMESERAAFDEASELIASVRQDIAGADNPPGGDRAAAADDAPAFGSAVYTCLRTKGRLFGVLCVRSKKTRAYSTHQVKLLDAVSSYVSIALDNATIYQQLDDVSKKVAELANHDTLTGIPNRRLLMELAPKAYASALRSNSKVAFLFMDLDNFKPINDKYGHQAGDDVLRIFKERVLGLIRSADIFARMGGDEFVVVMTDLKISSNAGTLARKIIREAAKPIIINDAENFIGVSIGISIFPDDSKDTDVLIVMADEAMYRVKHETKNNFTFFNEFIE